MVLKPDQERLKALLKETITLLCKNGLNYSTEFCIEALIGITLDKDDVMLVSINETVQTDEASYAPSTSETDFKSRKCTSASSTPHRESSNPPTPKSSVDFDSSSNQGSSSRRRHDRKRSHTDASGRDSDYYEGSSPTKRASHAPAFDSSDVVVIKEESDNEDTNSCAVSKSSASVQSAVPPEFAGINFEQAQLVPMSGAIPGCSSWSAVGPPAGQQLGMNPQPDFPMMAPPLEPAQTRGDETELVPGSGVYIPTQVYNSLSQEYFPKGSKLVRRLVHTIFPDDYELANSSCLGKRGDSCHKGLDQRKVEAIKDFTLCRYPEMQYPEVIQAINVCCCQARQKLKGKCGPSGRCGPPPDNPMPGMPGAYPKAEQLPMCPKARAKLIEQAFVMGVKGKGCPRQMEAASGVAPTNLTSATKASPSTCTSAKPPDSSSSACMDTSAPVLPPCQPKTKPPEAPKPADNQGNTTATGDKGGGKESEKGEDVDSVIKDSVNMSLMDLTN